MTSASSKNQGPERPVLHRLLHAFGEAVLGLVLAGGLFVAIWELVCYGSTRCEDFTGLAYMIFSFIAALVISGVYISLCRRFRNRLNARVRLDTIVGVITLVVWAGYLIHAL